MPPQYSCKPGENYNIINENQSINYTKHFVSDGKQDVRNDSGKHQSNSTNRGQCGLCNQEVFLWPQPRSIQWTHQKQIHQPK